jgi:hypothetical protein
MGVKALTCTPPGSGTHRPPLGQFVRRGLVQSEPRGGEYYFPPFRWSSHPAYADFGEIAATDRLPSSDPHGVAGWPYLTPMGRCPGEDTRNSCAPNGQFNTVLRSSLLHVANKPPHAGGPCWLGWELRVPRAEAAWIRAFQEVQDFLARACSFTSSACALTALRFSSSADSKSLTGCWRSRGPMMSP